MIETLNQISSSWFNTMVLFELQNSIFIGLILMILFFLKRGPASLKKSLILIGLFKTLIPPSFDLFNINITSQTLFLPLTTGNFRNTVNIPPSIPDISENLITFQSWLFGFWIFGMFVLALIIVKNQLKLRLILHSGKPIYCNHEVTNSKIRFFISKQISNPFVIGLTRPKVLLPGNWEQLEPALQKSIVLHEVNHIKANDLFWNYLKLLSLILHFFNPLNWLLVFLCDLYMEMACDDLTLKNSELTPKHYIKNILTVAESMAVNDYCATTLNFSRTFKILRHRISYQLKKEEEKMRNFKMLNKILPFLLVVLIIPFSWQCQNSDKPSIQEPVNTSAQDADFEIINNLYPFYMADEKPVMLHKERPVYPDEARRNGVSGLVVITVTIDEKGNVIEAVPLKEIKVKDESGAIVQVQKVNRHFELEPAAVQAALKCKFKPAKIQGKPIKVKMNIPFRFRLR